VQPKKTADKGVC